MPTFKCIKAHPKQSLRCVLDGFRMMTPTPPSIQEFKYYYFGTLCDVTNHSCRPAT